MGSTARVTLESDVRSEAKLERDAAAIRAVLADVEAALTRFRSDSELSRLNADRRTAVPASPLMRDFVLAVRAAGAPSGGLVDATLLAPLERQGYTTSRAGVAPADLAARTVPAGVRFAISCGGDVAVGGARGAAPWEVAVHSARTGAAVHPPARARRRRRAVGGLSAGSRSRGRARIGRSSFP
jgi:thiamine biosynthesis lipoprotein ApbE